MNGAVRPLGLLLGLVFCCACSRQPRPTHEDEVLLLRLCEARNLHRRADLHLLNGNQAAAIEEVQKVLTIQFPPGNVVGEETLLDAHARLSMLFLRQGGEQAEARALSQIEIGRKLVTRDTFFAANLETVAAEIHEAKAARLVDPAAKQDARKQALAALERAIGMDRKLVRTFWSSSDQPEVP